MHLNEYQELASETEQRSGGEEADHELSSSRLVALLGLVGEVGSLMSEFKKRLRDGPAHSRFRDHLAEELGDILWYLASVASKAGLTLEEIAIHNLDKTRDRWRPPTRHYLYDEGLPPKQQLPRTFAYRFVHEEVEGRTKLCMRDVADSSRTGDPLTDNSYEDDGYRFHDAMHLTFAAMLGWSPVYRKLLRTQEKIVKRYIDDGSDEGKLREDTEDGGRAQVIEEAIVAAAYVYDVQHPRAKRVDGTLLQHIKELTSGVEVSSRSEGEWERTLLHGFAIWEQLRHNGGGIVRGNLAIGTIDFELDHDANAKDN